MAKAPAARGFTLAEKRALLFERVSLYAVFLVALIAAAISFIALRAVGADAGLGSASFLLPIAIDGFGIACSVGIVRSVASGEGVRERTSEWFGLFAALGLSILGNVHHALIVGAGTLPDYVKVAYAAAIPMIVAYGIHVYGRAMARGISAHVLAENPDQIVFEMRHLGETVSAQRAPVRTAPRPAPRTQAAQPATPAAQLPRTVTGSKPIPVGDNERQRARIVFDQLVAADPTQKPDAAVVHREAGVTRDKATTRRWVQSWWDETQEAMGMGTDPQAGQLAAEKVTEDRTARTA